MSVWFPIKCPHCHSIDIIKRGKSAEKKQRYLCQNDDCPYTTFILDHSYAGRSRVVKQQIIEMALNGSGVRDIARVLNISTTTVIEELKKRPSLKSGESQTSEDSKT